MDKQKTKSDTDPTSEPAGPAKSEPGNGPEKEDASSPAHDAARPHTVRAEIDEGKLSWVSRRELLKLLPVLGLGAFAVPGWQEPLLKKGLELSDWASSKLF